MTDPRLHEAHELPLAYRLIDDLIDDYVITACGIAAATYGKHTDHDKGAQHAIDAIHHLHLAGWDHRLTPRIVDALKRAGLLRTSAGETKTSNEED